MILLAFCSIVLASGFLIMTFYSGFTDQVKSELKNKAIFLEKSLNLEENQAAYMERLNLSDTELRITLVDADGTVQYDNTVTDESHLENHYEREEIKEALTGGVGEAKRLSESIGKETYYYALRLSDGCILRVGKTTSSIYGVFFGVLPQSLFVIAILVFACLFVARSLTKTIVNPINTFDFEKNSNSYDELAPFIRTITAQNEQIQKALDEITKKSAVIDAITKSMNEGLILTDKDGVVLSANQSVMSILSVKFAPVGKNILEITRNTVVLEKIKSALGGDNNDTTIEIGNKTYHIFFSSVDTGALVLFLDVTEKAKAEKMRREFTANVSHELKTPLTTISGFAELLSKGMVKTEDVIEVSKKVKSESDRLIALVEDIMRLSELDESNGEKVYEQFDLSKLAAEVSENLKSRADEAIVTVNIPNKKNHIVANRQMLFELLYNLIENGIKYNKPGGTVTVSVTHNDHKAQISVKDTGIGIDKKHHDRIFERFYRVDKSRSKKIGGTGLGLSIVKHIAVYHGGSVEILSKINEGTEIKVEIPVTQS